jgi:hypothetical protein
LLTTGTALTFTINQLGAYPTASRVRAIVTTTGVNGTFIEGDISNISTATPSITFTPDYVLTGTGGIIGASYSNWTFSVAGVRGVPGPSGNTGTNGSLGPQGIAGPGYYTTSGSTVSLTTGSHTWIMNTATQNVLNLGSYAVNNYVFLTPQDAGAVSGEAVYGSITAISTTTPSVTVNVISVTLSTGSSRSYWAMSIGGLTGLSGLIGASGPGYSYSTSTSSITYSIGQHGFTVNDGINGIDSFGFGDRIKIIETTQNLNDYRFMSGYLIAKTGTNWTINVDTIVPTTATNLTASSWRVALTGDATTQTSQNIIFLSTQSATSTSSAALVVSGGVGIGGSTFVGQWLVPQSMSSATAKSYTGTPTGATVFLTGTGYNVPAYWNGTKWYLNSGPALY